MLFIERIRQFTWIVLVAAGAFLPPVLILASGHTLVWRDSANLFEPLRGFIVDALRDFRLPLWNPHEALGIPLFAQMMHGVLHPVSLLGALFAPQAGMNFYIVIYVVLAALGAAVLARTLGTSRGAAAVAGVGYGLSGYVLGMSAVVQYLTAGATAPWTLVGMRAAGEGRPRGIVAAALTVTALHFAGDPQWTIMAMLLGAALALDAGRWRGLVRAAIGTAVGTALAGVQLVPAWAYVQETVRAGGLSPVDRAQWALAPARLVEMVAPGLFGGQPGVAVVSPVFQWLGGETARGLYIPFVPSVFIGAGLLALAAAGAMVSRPARVLGVGVVVSLWLALGTHAGAEQMLHTVPIWGSFRYAEKLVGPLTLCLAILAAFGSDRLASRPSVRWALLAAAAGLLCIALAAVLAAWRGVEGLFDGELARAAVPLARLRLAIGLVHAGLGLTLLPALLVAASRQPAFLRRFPAAAAAFVVLQSAAASPFALRVGTRGVREQAPLSGIRSPGPITRIVTPLEDPPYQSPLRLDEADRETAALSRMGVAPFAVPVRIDHVNTYTGIAPGRLRLLFRRFGPELWAGLRRFGLTHVVVKDPTDLAELEDARAAIQGGRLIRKDGAWGFTVWEVPRRPWAAFAARALSAKSEGEALQRVFDGERRGDPTVILEGPAPERLAPGRILAVERRAESARVEAESEGDGVLVVNDAFWPGWTAAIDGRPVPVWRADFLVRAVPWPAGRHVLEMRYEPAELRAGLRLSAAGALAVVLLWGMSGWARSRGGKP